MNRWHSSLRLGTIMLAALIGFGGLGQVNFAIAQDGGDTEQCVGLSQDAITTAKNSCGDLPRGEICLGYGTADAAQEGAVVPLGAGESLTVADVSMLRTSNAVGSEGVVIIQLPASLPETDPGVTAILFGDAILDHPAVEVVNRPTLPVSNPASAPVNLREGAGVNYAIIDSLDASETAVADGRNEQGDWLRLQTTDGIAWAFVRVIDWEGDINSLDVLLPNDMSGSFVASAPFERVTLETSNMPECAVAPSGLMLHHSGEDIASLRIDDVTLAFADASLVVRATSGDSLQVMVLSGSVTVTARGIPEDAVAGEVVSVSLAGESGLEAVAVPAVQPSYAFADVAYLPIELFPGSEDMVCQVGAADPALEVILRVGPGENRGTLVAMNPNASYTVIGQAAYGDGAPWWQLDTGNQKSWVAQSDVRTIGACDAVVAVEPPPLVFAPPAAPVAGENGVIEDVDDFSPETNSVWQMNPGSDNMSGECSGAPAINFCDHLAAISPAQGGVMWKGMEASPYYLQRIQPNVYAYSGPNVLGTGTVNMTLRFTSDGALTMTQSLTLNSEPACVHTYYYSGTKNW